MMKLISDMVQADNQTQTIHCAFKYSLANIASIFDLRCLTLPKLFGYPSLFPDLLQ